MSQDNNFWVVSETSSISSNINTYNEQINQNLSANLLNTLNNNNDDDWKSAKGDDDDDLNINDAQNDLTITTEQENNEGWANFNEFENHVDSKPENAQGAVSNVVEDEWGSFESNAIHSAQHIIESAIDEQLINNNDILCEYYEKPIASQSRNCWNTDSIECLISTCFPLESLAQSVEVDNYMPLELPYFSTWKNQRKPLSCFKPGLSLWKMLSNIAYDPIGIQYQWRKSHMEHLFHGALGVNKRINTTTIPSNSNISTAEIQIIVSIDNNEVELPQEASNMQFDWQKHGLESPIIDDDNSTLSIKSNHSDDNIFDVKKSSDLDYYIPSMQTLTWKKEDHGHSSTTAYRNTSSIVQQNSTPIKTMNLFPGSSRILNEDAKPVVDAVLNFSSMNPKELMFSTKT